MLRQASSIRRQLPAVLLLLVAVSGFAADRAVMVREAQIYINPDASTPKLGSVARGREVVVLESTRGWVKVLASVSSEQQITGWILDKGLVHASNPEGDKILFGEAATAEDEASRRGGRRGAPQDAMRLYARCAEYWPQSPLAGEALYRAADVRWQLEAVDIRTRPSYRNVDPDTRAHFDEDAMHEVMRKFKGTKWADMAAYHLLENKMCGDWQAQSKCPEKEAEIYEKYAGERPQSPNAPEALYEAARRRASLIEIYKMENEAGKSGESRSKALALTQRIMTQYPQGDWAGRARALQFQVEQDIPVFGNQLQ